MRIRRYLTVITVVLTLISNSEVYAKPIDINKLIQEYRLALKKSNFDILAPHISDTFKINKMRAKPSLIFFESEVALSTYSGMKLEIGNYENITDNITVVHTTHIFKKKGTKKILLHFAKEGPSWKLVHIYGDIIDFSNKQTIKVVQKKDENFNIISSDTTERLIGKEIENIYNSEFLGLEEQINKVIGNDTINKVDEDGNYDGFWELKHPDGSFRCKGVYIHGKKDGYWERKYKNGNWMYQANFKDGSLHGHYKKFHENGNLELEGDYYDGLMNGLFKFYHENGNLELEEHYSHDIRNGSSKFFNKEGVLIGAGIYKNGKRDGVWLFYNSKGKINVKVKYNLGKAIKTEQVNN